MVFITGDANIRPWANSMKKVFFYSKYQDNNINKNVLENKKTFIC